MFFFSGKNLKIKRGVSYTTHFRNGSNMDEDTLARRDTFEREVTFAREYGKKKQNKKLPTEGKG